MQGKELLVEGATNLYFITKDKNIYVEKVISILNGDIKYSTATIVGSIEGKGFGDKYAKSETVVDRREESIELNKINKIVRSEDYYKSDVNWDDYFIF